MSVEFTFIIYIEETEVNFLLPKIKKVVIIIFG